MYRSPYFFFFATITLWVNASGGPLEEILEVECIESTVELVVRRYRWNVDEQLSFTTRAFYYLGVAMVPGPTLIMKAGTSCSLTITNDLDTESPVSTCDYHTNEMHCADTTNVHVHGLYVDPNVDDMSVSILPGKSWTYHYEIPEDHTMGSFWYHAHYHGSSDLQVAGGLSGAIKMLPADAYNLPQDLVPLYENDQILVLNHVNFNGSDYDIYEMDLDEPFGFYDYPGTSALFEFQTILPDQTFYTNERDIYVVNGMFQPVVTIPTASASLLRFIHVGATRLVEIEIDDENSNCEVVLIARDGVFQYVPYLSLNVVFLLQGTRSDVAFKCSVSGDYNIRVYPNPDRDDDLNIQNRHSQETLFTLRVVDQPEGSQLVELPISQADLPDYLTDLQGFAKFRDGSTDGLNGIPGGAVVFHADEWEQLVSGRPFYGFDAEPSAKYIETYCVDGVYDLKVKGITKPGKPHAETTSHHPYHQHVYHFQIITSNFDGDKQAGGQIQRIGEWRDTMLAENTFGTGIRWRPTRFTGDMIMHCHIFQHGDYGSMQIFQITEDAEVCETIAAQNGWSDLKNDAFFASVQEFDLTSSSGKSFVFSSLLVGFLSLAVLAVACVLLWRYHKKRIGHQRLEEDEMNAYETTDFSELDRFELR